MFGLSGEHIVIFLIILLIFGPRRLPELGNTLGKAIKNFKDSMSGVQEAKYRNLDNQTDSAQIISETKATVPPAAEATTPSTGSAVTGTPGAVDPTKKS